MAGLPGCICRTLRSSAPKVAGPSQLAARRSISSAIAGRRAGVANGGVRPQLLTARATSLLAGRMQQSTSSYYYAIGTAKDPPAARSMFVQTEVTPNEDSLKFIPTGAEPLSTSGQTHEFLNATDARKSPLASALFDIPGVRLVFFGPDFLTVSKSEDTQWALLKPEVYSVIIEHFTQGKSLFYEGHNDADGPEDTRILDTDSEVVAMVKELLDTRVRPAIQEDGGDIEYKGFAEDTGVVQVALKGSCRGCDSSTVTLKNGIERMLMHYIPEVKAVEQIISQEEAIAADEFAKFEARLREGGKTVEI